MAKSVTNNGSPEFRATVGRTEKGRLETLLAERPEVMEAWKEAEAGCARARQMTEDWYRRYQSVVELARGLPGDTKGRGSREQNRLHLETLTPRPRVTRADQFEAYREHAHIFPDKQWRAIQLFYGEELTQAEAGRRMGIARNSVSELLKRAKDRLGKHKKELRLELIRETRRDV